MTTTTTSKPWSSSIPLLLMLSLVLCTWSRLITPLATSNGVCLASPLTVRLSSTLPTSSATLPEMYTITRNVPVPLWVNNLSVVLAQVVPTTRLEAWLSSTASFLPGVSRRTLSDWKTTSTPLTWFKWIGYWEDHAILIPWRRWYKTCKRTLYSD